MGLYDSETLVSFNGVNYGWKGDFLGFTIGNVHSSQLGIVRVSDGDRYNDDLFPTFTDKTATVSGLDKTYYFGSDYTQKTFTIKFVFDHLTDKQLRELRRIFSKKEPQDLIFDELPYKVYSVKCSSPPQLSYLCFDEDLERIYKGEGTVNFVAYSPYAKSRFKYLEDYNIKNIPEWGGVKDNKMAWLESSGIISKNGELGGKYLKGSKLDKYDSSCRIQLFNPGDKETSCQILCNVSDFYLSQGYGFQKFVPIFALVKNKPDSFTWENIKTNATAYLALDPDKIRLSGVASLMIDSRKKLIYGSNDPIKDTTTPETFLSTANKQIYNNCIYSGDFFNIPQINKEDSLLIRVLNPPKKPKAVTNETTVDETVTNEVTVDETVTNEVAVDETVITIELDNVLIYYDYLYL